MLTLFNEKGYNEIVGGLRSIGYNGALLAENYRFADYFTTRRQEREIAAAAFGQTPTSYESACIGVALANGLRERPLVNQFRALGAPILLELDSNEVREWAVSRNKDDHGLVQRYPTGRIGEMFASRAPDWKPQPLLRAKKIGSFQWAQQLGLFAGLLPELEEHIQDQLEPLLRGALAAAKASYAEATGRQPDPDRLFKLIFWLLTGKVFHDRRVNGFDSLGPSSDEIIAAVARQYREEVPHLLNREARETAASRIWRELDFRNLSVEVLSLMWSRMLLDERTKRRLGIHRTSRTLVRYIVDRIPFEQVGDDKRIVLEPCSGSSVFLIGAMNVLRHKLFGATPAERHRYFIHHLAGIEKDPFGVEISRLALTLADFPNPGGWDIVQGDVFGPGTLTGRLRRAGVVLCNPPFSDFEKDERLEYKPSSTHKPVELLNRILDDLHPGGVLGFVLPRNIVDGRGYAAIRRRLAQRFATLQLTLLPDRAFEADPEVGILIASDPIPHHACRVLSRRVADTAGAWRQFELTHEVTSEHAAEFGPEEAQKAFAVPPLPDLWDFLVNYPTLSEVAELHRGIEWNTPLTKKGAETGNRANLVKKHPSEGFILGVAPQTAFNIFEQPPTRYLSVRPQDQRGNAYKHPWNRPKAILNKSARSRGPWRLAAFPDHSGVTCYQTYIGVWAKSAAYDEWLLAAVLNSPLANAFVATREGKTDVTMEVLGLIPTPHFTESQREKLRLLIRRYQATALSSIIASATENPGRILTEIDALVLDAYRLPPRLEHNLLEFFRGRGHDRPTPHDFPDYLPPDREFHFSLSEQLTPEFAAAASDQLLNRMKASQEER